MQAKTYQVYQYFKMKDLRSNCLVTLFIIMFSSCGEKSKEKTWLWENCFYGTPVTDSIKYFREKADNLLDINPKYKSEITFIFRNNPYLLDSSYYVKIYSNYRIVYSGKFCKYGKMKTFIVDSLQHRVNMEVEIFKNGKYYRFDRNKDSGMMWHKNFIIFNIIFSNNVDRLPVDYFFQ